MLMYFNEFVSMVANFQLCIFVFRWIEAFQEAMILEQ